MAHLLDLSLITRKLARHEGRRALRASTRACAAPAARVVHRPTDSATRSPPTRSAEPIPPRVPIRPCVVTRVILEPGARNYSGDGRTRESRREAVEAFTGNGEQGVLEGGERGNRAPRLVVVLAAAPTMPALHVINPKENPARELERTLKEKPGRKPRGQFSWSRHPKSKALFRPRPSPPASTSRAAFKEAERGASSHSTGGGGAQDMVSPTPPTRTCIHFSAYLYFC